MFSMIYGIGIDKVEVARIEKSMQTPGFADKCFSKEELNERKGKKAESYAAAFAAKEAFSKALGTGIGGIGLKEVSLLHEKSGKPYLKITGDTLSKIEPLNLIVHVSVTHEAGIAQCVVILETGAPKNKKIFY